MDIPTYEDLYKLAFVPNQWICRECGFMLTKNTIRASDGAIGTTAKDRQSEECPNDGEWMEPVTWKETAEELNKRLIDALGLSVQVN